MGPISVLDECYTAKYNEVKDEDMEGNDMLDNGNGIGLEVELKPMTPEMYHMFFQEYENDMDLYLDKNDFHEYVYEESKVDAYIQRQIDLNRKPFAIMYGDEMVGELKIYDIQIGKSAVLGITMKNHKYKDRGFGTIAERLAVDYVFHQLDRNGSHCTCLYYWLFCFGQWLL